MMWTLTASVIAVVVGSGAPMSDPPKLAHLHEIPFTKVKIQDGFWSPRIETSARVSLAHSLKMLDEFGNLGDLDLAAQNKREGYKGPVFSDSDTFKVLESVSYSLATTPNPELDKQLDAIIARMAAAQREDGYLNTWYEVNEPDRRFTNLRDNHELYCAGHLFEAAAAHAQATGKKNLLNIATNYADLLCKTFGNGPGQRPGYCGHPEIELALIKLARVTGEQRYFDLAKFFLDSRGSKFFASEHHTPEDQYNGDYWQDNCAIREHTHVVGHAVRFAYLMSGTTDVAAQTDDQGMLSMLRRVWRNTTGRNTYITGGIGPSASNEGFTKDYDLPNQTAYQETCASVAMAMWNHRMNLAYGDAKYADCVETALYNGILAGVSLDGKKFFYVNPLTSQGGHHRSDWFGCACCPPNVTRTLASLGSYAYATDDHGVWVNLYVQGSTQAKLDGHDVALRVTTDYPWSGAISIAVDADTNVSFPLRLRVPGWCSDAKVQVNGQAFAAPSSLGYLVVDRSWAKGDHVELNLPMPVRRVEAHPNVIENRGRQALMRGPLVYCVEGCDVDGSFWTMALPTESELSIERRDDLLGGVTVIRGHATTTANSDWTDGLYRTVPAPQRTSFVAVPYYAWDNRTPGPMQVWLPTTPPPPRAMSLEGQARVSVSFKSGYAQPEGIHDGIEPRDSSEQPPQLCHWWPHKGGTEWVAYSWAHPVAVSSIKIYWFDDTGRGECRFPASARLLYKDGAEFKPVPGSVPINKDAWCSMSFPAITTSELRLELVMKDGWAAGIHEWKVEAPEPE